MLKIRKLLCLSLLLFSSNSLAQEEQKEDKDATLKTEQEGSDTAEYTPLPEDDWTRSIHQGIAKSVDYSAQWFDSFFLDEGDNQQTPDTSARIKLSWEPRARDFEEFDSKFRVKVKLPHFSNKASLIFSDDAEDELSKLPLEKTRTRPELNEDTFAAAVRFVNKKTANSTTTSRIGISGGDIFTRLKHRRTYLWNNDHSLKIEPSVYYYLDDKLGAKILFEYNYQQSPVDQYRFDYSIRGSESFSGIRWNHGFYHLHQISERQASVLGIGVNGERNGERGFVVKNYTFSYRHRFNAYRKWLYFEIEPFFEFPEEENYKITPGIALSIEGYFYRVD